MKKKIFVCAILVVCLSLLAYGTLAYFNYQETATNVITAGNVRIALREWSRPADGEQVPFEDVLNVLPGQSVSKVVQVENVGGQAAWVRISLDKAVSLVTSSETPDASLVSYDIDTEHWTLQEDGYYYYNEALQPGESTEPLFTQVLFADTMGNAYQGSTVTIRVDAQATQVANNGETVFEAAGWPEEIQE